MSTPHNQAEMGDFAETVLLPGDPLRAKFIAENFLTDAVQVNGVRNALAFTGYYKGKRVSVMGSGMGMPSLGIYVYELYTMYGVKNIIRIGSCGAYSSDCKLYDLIIAEGACTDSAWAHQYNLPGTYSAIADFELLGKAYHVATAKKFPLHVGNILSSDIFYNASGEDWKKWQKMGCLAVEMETYALYATAAYLGKKALTILTVSDSFCFSEITTAEERQNSFRQMMEVALEIA